MNPATLLALVALHSPASHPDRPLETCPAHVVTEFNALDDALRHLRGQLQEVRKRDHRRHLQEDLDAAFAASQRARVAACRAATAPPVVVAPRVLREEEHHQLTHAVRREAFEDARLGVLTLGVQGVCVTSSQTKELVREMAFTRGRMQALQVIAPRIVDRERSYEVLEAFTFESDKRRARELLAQAPQSPECAPYERITRR